MMSLIMLQKDQSVTPFLSKRRFYYTKAKKTCILLLKYSIRFWSVQVSYIIHTKKIFFLKKKLTLFNTPSDEINNISSDQLQILFVFQCSPAFFFLNKRHASTDTFFFKKGRNYIRKYFIYLRKRTLLL